MLGRFGHRIEASRWSNQSTQFPAGRRDSIARSPWTPLLPTRHSTGPSSGDGRLRGRESRVWDENHQVWGPRNVRKRLKRGGSASLAAVEVATLVWVDWFDNRRLLGPIGDIPPAEFEAQDSARTLTQVTQAGTEWRFQMRAQSKT